MIIDNPIDSYEVTCNQCYWNDESIYYLDSYDTETKDFLCKFGHRENSYEFFGHNTGTKLETYELIKIILSLLDKLTKETSNE